MTRALWTVGFVVAAAVLGIAATSDFGLVFTLAVTVLMLSVWKPQLAIFSAVAVAIWPVGEIAGMQIGYAAVGLVSIGVLVRYMSQLPKMGKPGAMIIVMVAVIVISYVVNPPTRLVTQLEARNHLIATLLGFLLVTAVAVANPDRRIAIRTLALAGAASSCYLVATGSVAAGRLATDELNENGVGHVGAIAFVCAIAAYADSRHIRWLMVAIMPGALVVLSQSRGAVLIAAIGLIVLWSVGRSWRTRVFAVAVVPTGVVIAWPLILSAVDFLFSRRTLRNAGTADRLQVLQLAGDMTLQSPILGIGWRKFPEASLGELGTALNTHNEYARLAAESGLITVSLFILLAAMALRVPNVGSLLKAPLAATLAAFGLANTMSELDVSTPAWVLLGLLLAARTHPINIAPSVVKNSTETGMPEPVRTQTRVTHFERTIVAPK